jgi:acyl-CoA thioester hydrolase
MSKQWEPERVQRETYPGDGVDLTVFYGDLDTNGHLNNVAFGRFFEQARFTAHRALKLGPALAAEGRHLLVARIRVDYLAEGQFGQDMHVRTQISHLGNSSFVEQQGAWQGDVCVALAEITMVIIGDGAPVRISDDVREVLSPLLAGGSGVPASA